MSREHISGTLLGIAVRAASRAPIRVLQEASVTRENGVEGDFRGRPGNRQVMVFDCRAWQEVCAELRIDLPWTTRRANLLIEGICLKESTGDFLHIGSLVIEVTGETFPCKRMDEAYPGLRAALTPSWRGGAACRVVDSGTIRIGDRG